ncbi:MULTISPECIES: oligopeptide ABC transporter permease [unclassified Breznakia]|uniref:oligopeptide ABC transporter permease n=1 Tax=unclassified Breznakia TaxID=2623764 RepID=UPI0024732C04|nr:MULTISPECIES: oligopeptide ABC transporter permease [unclassified Breznakia]MDH6367579.1 peptide/nickel transport system permease protein [Breznakia sp. PH1-1]MDH6404699.1 peptide/nickel transport system permease protein [Breznakia sp. PF1-11]MDH6412409.1 peptide/nickel transport system permease protein [Breznakia sp. PFB1-11]MDH6414774.1 peptide/nickel transport system permease protein [Breznakia sp. PFB1-14]MDH6417080.1 peptide/nickel transport system permease protein [Breznakia sp. PFB1-
MSKDQVIEPNVVVREEDQEVLGPWRIAWNKFKKNKIAMAGLILFVIIVLAVIFGPIIMGQSVNDFDFAAKGQGPSLSHLLGTDEQGRDVLFRLLLGGRISILVGVVSAVITVLLGVIIGGAAGYYGGLIDNLLMRFTEIIYSLPFTPMIIALGATMMWVEGNIKMIVVSFLIGLLSWPTLARLVRGQILSLREQEFMQACESLGLSDFSKIFKHLIPNVLSIVIVNATLSMASAILTEAGLSFLGMGVTEPTPTWGNLMQLARDISRFQNMPWTWMPAGVMCFLTVISINLVGEGLRDALDPKDVR